MVGSKFIYFSKGSREQIPCFSEGCSIPCWRFESHVKCAVHRAFFMQSNDFDFWKSSYNAFVRRKPRFMILCQWAGSLSAVIGNRIVSKWVVPLFVLSWWRHQMETFSALMALCGGNPSVIAGLPHKRAVTRSLWYFLWSAPQQRINQTVEICNSIALIMTSL